VVICLERDADLHTAQLMPLPLTVSCFSKIQIGFTFLVPARPGSPGIRAVKRVYVWCMCPVWSCGWSAVLVVELRRMSECLADDWLSRQDGASCFPGTGELHEQNRRRDHL